VRGGSSPARGAVCEFVVAVMLLLLMMMIMIMMMMRGVRGEGSMLQGGVMRVCGRAWYVFISGGRKRDTFFYVLQCGSCMIDANFFGV